MQSHNYNSPLCERTLSSNSRSTNATSVKSEVFENYGLECLPESILHHIISFAPRVITISYDESLITDFKVYSEPHEVPTLLRLNRDLRAKGRKFYRLSFKELLNDRPIYFQFATDTLIISDLEAFNQFLIPIGYSPLNPDQEDLWKERQYIDLELRHLAFGTPLYNLSMHALVRFRSLREVIYLEWPESGARTRSNRRAPSTVSSDLCLPTFDLWRRSAGLRKQEDFNLPKMVQVSREEFEVLFSRRRETESQWAEWLQGKGADNIKTVELEGKGRMKDFWLSRLTV